MFASDGFAKIINDAVDHAYAVFPAYGASRAEKMSVQTIDADAKSERGGKPVLSAATKVQGRILNVASTQPVTPVWEGSGNSCPAAQYISRSA